MKVFPYEQLSYFDAVQAFLLELTGKGIVLSGRDVQLLVAWRRRGATPAAICRGMMQANRELRDPPRDIWACRHYIEPLVERTTAHAAGAPVAIEKTDLKESALRRIETAGKLAKRDAFKDAYRAAWRRIKDVPGDDVFDELLNVENELLGRYWAALSLAEQAGVLEKISEEVSSMGGMSEAARDLHQTARRRVLLRDEFGLIPLVDD